MKISTNFAINIAQDIYNTIERGDEELQTHIVDIYTDDNLLFSCNKVGYGDLYDPVKLVEYSKMQTLIDSFNNVIFIFYNEKGEKVFEWELEIENVQPGVL